MHAGNEANRFQLKEPQVIFPRDVAPVVTR